MIHLELINKDIFYKNGDAKQRILNNISLKIEAGEFVSIVGPSGSGKSTLINIIGMLDSEYSGKYYFNDKLVSKFSDEKISKIRNRSIGFIFQNFKLLSKYTVKENIQLPLIYSPFGDMSDRHIRDLLAMVELEEKINEYPTNLSGGQQQRIAIARALVNNPEIIIADEPTGALDSKMSQKILSILKKINQTGNTVIMVTHSLEAASTADRTLHIVDGVLTED